MPAHAQGGFPGYYRYRAYVQKADSVLHAGNPAGAARFYRLAAETRVEKGIDIKPIDPYLSAARAWAGAAMPDSAFSALDKILALGFTGDALLMEEKDFYPLHADSRWPALLARAGQQREDAGRIARRAALRTDAAAISETVFRPPSAYLRQFLYNDTIPFISVNHGPFRLYFSADSYTASHLDEVKAGLDTAVARILSVLFNPPYRRGINLVVVDTRQDMQELTGFNVGGGLAVAEHDVVFMVWNGERRLQARHEIFHVISTHVLGQTSSRLINEGSAVMADDACFIKEPVHRISAGWMKKGKLFALEDLIGHFDDMALKNDVIAYLQSASVVKYLYERYGYEKFSRLWAVGFDGFEAIYGFGITELARRWKGQLENYQPPSDAELEMILKEGCG